MVQVKPEQVQAGQEGELSRHGKIVSEVFLTRLLSTKVTSSRPLTYTQSFKGFYLFSFCSPSAHHSAIC